MLHEAVGYLRPWGLGFVRFGGREKCCRSHLSLVKADGKQLNIKIYLCQFPHNIKQRHQRHSQNLNSYL